LKGKHFAGFEKILPFLKQIFSSSIFRTQTTLRHILGGKVLQECVENRDSIAQEVQAITGRVADEWGVKVFLKKIIMTGITKKKVELD
jgi:hypothetical protein